MNATFIRNQSLIHFDGASLFKHVDHGMRISTQTKRRARTNKFFGRADAICEVTLGCGAKARKSFALAEQINVGTLQVSCVYRSRE